MAALLATFAITLHGYSCGHDFDFHLQSWVDAARQLRGGTLYPRWIFSAAYNAGEPRFIFYPPLSWMLGAVLALCLPIVAAPAVYVWIALTAAGFSMHRLARHFVSSEAALFVSALYLANPYMLFNAVERAADAELLAAAWIPLLFLAVLRARPTISGIAIPVALLWLTNAPAAVMGCYTLAVLAAIRLLWGVVHRSSSRDTSAPSPWRVFTNVGIGTLLGLALPAFYLIPAAYERRYVQIALALIPNMRFEDNFLFMETADEPHNEVLQTASVLAVVLLVLTAVAAAVLFVFRRRRPARFDSTESMLAPSLIFLTALIAFMLVPLSTPLWRHLPELAFLQFPWRLLTILAVVLALALALVLDYPLERFGGQIMFAAPICALALGLLCVHLYRQPCDTYGRPRDVFKLFNTHHGVLATEEYTPQGASNDVLRSDNPGYWLSSDPEAFAPQTKPNPPGVDLSSSDAIPIEDTISATAPQHLTLNLVQPETLILNLRDFPNWRLTRNGTELPPHLKRDDGLLAVALPGGPSIIDISWRRSFDQELGLVISAIAVLVLGLLHVFARPTVRISLQQPP